MNHEPVAVAWLPDNDAQVCGKPSKDMPPSMKLGCHGNSIGHSPTHLSVERSRSWCFIHCYLLLQPRNETNTHESIMILYTGLILIYLICGHNPLSMFHSMNPNIYLHVQEQRCHAVYQTDQRSQSHIQSCMYVNYCTHIPHNYIYHRSKTMSKAVTV